VLQAQLATNLKTLHAHPRSGYHLSPLKRLLFRAAPERLFCRAAGAASDEPQDASRAHPAGVAFRLRYRFRHTPSLTQRNAALLCAARCAHRPSPGRVSRKRKIQLKGFTITSMTRLCSNFRCQKLTFLFVPAVQTPNPNL